MPLRPAPVDLAVDTSALISMWRGEPTAQAVAAALERSKGAVVSAPSVLEASMVALARSGEDGVAALDELIEACALVVIPADPQLVRLARAAFARFGKGRHRAGLNFGDCFSYALAQHFDVPLLCVGDDFPLTDLAVLPV